MSKLTGNTGLVDIACGVLSFFFTDETTSISASSAVRINADRVVRRLRVTLSDQLEQLLINGHLDSFHSDTDCGLFST